MIVVYECLRLTAADVGFTLMNPKNEFIFYLCFLFFSFKNLYLSIFLPDESFYPHYDSLTVDRIFTMTKNVRQLQKYPGCSDKK